MQRLYLIRHAESASNAGLPTHSHATYPITSTERKQAERFANTWPGETPDLIVTSPYMRTQMTAAPFQDRFSAVPTERWGIQEWTHLSPSRYNGTTFEERRPHVEAFWEKGDPAYEEPGAESFSGLFERVNRILDHASERKEKTVVLFTHGHFMRAVLFAILIDAHPVTPEAMQRFLSFTKVIDIPNLCLLPLYYSGHWSAGQFRTLPLI